MTKLRKKYKIKMLIIKLSIIMIINMNMKYIYPMLGGLIIAAAICQDDLFILLQPDPEPTEFSEPLAVVADDSEEDETKSLLSLDENSACDQVSTATLVVKNLASRTANEIVKPVVIDKKDEIVKKEPAEVKLKSLDKRNVTVINGKAYPGLEDELIACIAYVENYFPSSYFCGARWTIGYGTTGYTNGKSVRPNQSISKEEAKDCVKYHLRNYVFPVIEQSVERELSQNEMLATCLFIYNIGGGNFTKGGRQCAFLRALNANEAPEKCARKMTEFNRSAGKRLSGLLKRRWVEGALFCGHISVEEILQLEPAGFYNTRALTDYYVSSRPDRDGFYSYRFDQDSVERFLDLNRGEHSVADII